MPVGFLFPGQGSQQVGMLNDYKNFTSVRFLFEEANDIASKDLWNLIENGPADDLSLTENTQPAMLAADVALWKIFQEKGKIHQEDSIWLAGHSLGEYAALVAAGSLPFGDAMRAVCYRARIMQEAVPEGVGAMAAVLGLAPSDVVGVCNSVSSPGFVVEAVNFNSSLQTVIGGHLAAVERAAILAKETGAKKVVFLDMSVPSHSSLMNNARDKMLDFLSGLVFSEPVYPIVHNLTADVCSDVGVLPKILADQLSSPVRWTDTISFMLDKSVRRFVQCGPGDVMAGLLRKISDITFLSSSDYCIVNN